MSYCTIDDLKRILPEKVTIGTQNIGTPVPGGGTQGRSNVSPADADYFIKYATAYVDSKLKNIFVTPLRKIKQMETEAAANVTHGNNVNVVVRDSGAFQRGDWVRLQNTQYMETCTIASVTNLTTFILAAVQYDYSETDTLVSIIQYPDPIPTITARFACSFILDKLWTSEQSPDISKYGSAQRNLAINNIDDILTGTILLFGQEQTGRRFVRGTLFDAYGSPYEKTTKGEEKEST